MPCGDGTGPLGLGPMTGRAAGLCAGYPVPGYMNPIPGRGFWGWGRGLGHGWGRGLGRGWRWWARAGVGPTYPFPQPWWPQPTPQQETELLKQQAEFLQSQLEAVQRRLDELAKEVAKE